MCFLQHFCQVEIIVYLHHRLIESSLIYEYLKFIYYCYYLNELATECCNYLIESYLVTRDNQFGFKKKHSTDLCIFCEMCNLILQSVKESSL